VARSAARLVSRRWLPILALLLVAVLPAAQWLHYGAERESRAAMALDVVLPLAVERGVAEAGPRLTLLPEMRWIALSVDPGFEVGTAASLELPYRVEGPGGGEVLRGTTRGTAGSASFLLVLEAARLKKGEHVLWLGPGAELPQALRFPFRVEPTDSNPG
jgi:hypothetical protein